MNPLKKIEDCITFIEEGVRYMQCHMCGSFVSKVSETVNSVICSKCTTIKCLSVWNPITSQKSKKPAGWHWMKEFVDLKGNVFYKGKEQPKLKGTLPSTEVKLRKKRAVRKKKVKSTVDGASMKEIQALAKEHKLKKKTQKKHKNDIKERQIQKAL